MAEPPLPARDPWDLVIELQLDEPGAIDAAIAYLEADPWAFRTGYLKSRLLHHLGNRRLTVAQRARLRPVLRHYCIAGQRWDFLDAVRLARRQRPPGLHDDLVELLHTASGSSGVRALRMLLALPRPRLTERDVTRGRAVVLTWAGTRPSPSWSAGWVAPLVLRLWGPGPAVAMVALDDLAGTADPEVRAGAHHLRAEIRRRYRQVGRPEKE